MPARPRSADDPPKRTPSFVCEVPLRVTPCPGTDAARPAGGGPPGLQRLPGTGPPTRAAGARVQSLSARQDAAPRRSRAEGALSRGARPARLFGVRAARLRPAVRPLLAGRAPGQPDHPDAGHSGLPRRQSAAPGEGPPGPVQGPAPAGHGRGQDQHQRHPLVRGPEWSGRGWCLPALLDPRDPVQAHGLACPVKYVRLVRRKLGERNRFYAQLVCQGTPYQKPQHHAGQRDRRAGPGTLDHRGGLRAGRAPAGVLSRGGSRRQSAAPAGSASSIGSAGPTTRPTTTSGAGSSGARQRWKVSKRQRKVQARRRELHRKLAATRKRSHGQLAHRVLALGSTFHLEQLSYRAWQKTYGKSVQLCAPGMFVERLSRLAASAGGTIVLINAWRARLSQTCHCGRIKKKARSQRWHVCPCGASAQRDLFSAYLARFVDPETSLLDAGQAQAAWPGWEPTRAAGV